MEPPLITWALTSPVDLSVPCIVVLEPVVNRIEKCREVTKRKLKTFWKRLMKECGLPPIQCNIIFPEIITQDRSQKLQDLLLMQKAKWITPQRAAEIAAKEMSMTDYDYASEQEGIAKMSAAPTPPAPLLLRGRILTSRTPINSGVSLQFRSSRLRKGKS